MFFEVMSGLKINLSRSILIPIGEALEFNNLAHFFVNLVHFFVVVLIILLHLILVFLWGHLQVESGLGTKGGEVSKEIGMVKI